MSGSSFAMLAAGSVVAVLAMLLVCWILYIIGYWKMFAKAGEPGWKAIIPFYNTYVCYKISWKNAVAFWLFLVASIAGCIISNTASSSTIATLGSVLTLAAFVVHVMQCHRLSCTFGHGVGFTIGLIFLNPLFVIVLGFGGSEYRGVQD